MADKFDPLVTEWMLFVKTLNYNLIEKCLKLAQLLEYPELDVNQYIEKIAKIGKAIKLDLTESKNPTYLISMLNEHLFAHHGFKGDVEDYYNPKNNFLNDVVDKKSGIPITLSILYTEIAKIIGLELKVVGFPSHVLVSYRQEKILDPFNGGRLVTVEDLQHILDVNFGGQVEFVPEFLNEMTDEEILIRLLRNLRRSYVESYSYEKAMRCTDMALALAPNAPEDIRDKGILEERLLHYETSLKYLNQYLEVNPNAEDVDFVLELIKNVRSKINR